MSELDSYDATLQHIELIARKAEKLIAAQVDAERQVLHRIGCDYAAGRLGMRDLLAVYARLRDAAFPAGPEGIRAHNPRPAFSRLWDEAVPLSSTYAAALLRAPWRALRYEQNGDGTWFGDNPLEPEAHRPIDGQCVVYVLFDDRNEPCYVGSTQEFKTRFDRHRSNKSFARWVAYPCEDREAAYQLEDRLLKEHKPYLNRKAGR